MRTMLRRTRMSMMGFAVLGALGFGASSALAEVRPEAACAEPFANGSCTTTSACAKYCKSSVGAGTGQCSSGCCYCIWF